MGSLTYLERARDAGLSVGTKDGRLILRGPRQAEDVVRLLIEHKAEVMAELGAPPSPSPPPPDWPTLAAPRWGPGLEDDTPGITVDCPDPARRTAALEAAAAEPDPYEIEERLAIRAESDPTAGLVGPRRTAWGTVVWSDPDEPSIEAFGPPPSPRPRPRRDDGAS